jgi:hypothetical protein
MTQYLLSIYQPTGGTPPPGLLERVTEDLAVLNGELKEAGAWVFAGGLHEPSTATEAALPLVDALDLDGYYVFHAVRADLLRRLGREGDAAAAYDAAIARADNAAQRAFLERRRG